MLLVFMWVGAAIASTVLTGLTRRYALQKAILDVPSERSSHRVPTPRGGGLAIMAAALGGIAVLGAMEVLETKLAIGLLGGGAFVGYVGWLDDKRGLASRTRFLAHLTAALWYLGWTRPLPPVSLGEFRLEFGWFGVPLAALTIVWFVNLYNFMDGIDGLAASEAVVVGSVGAAMLFALDRADLASVSLCISAAAAGFLFWNWPPAKIFMGDSGSGLLGFLFIALAIASESAGTVPLLAWVAMLGVFCFDATATLFRRILRGERWREAHRSHAYQRAARKVGSHAVATGSSIVLTAVLCLLAWWLTIVPQHAATALAMAVAVLAGVYWRVETIAPMSSGGSTDTAPPGSMAA